EAARTGRRGDGVKPLLSCPRKASSIRRPGCGAWLRPTEGPSVTGSPLSRGRQQRVTRRAFVAVVGGAAAAWPGGPHAQQSHPPIGYLSVRSSEAETPLRDAVRRGLEEAGYVEGRNVAIEYRFSGGQDERLPALAADLVRQRVAVLVATDTPSALVA